MNGLNHPYEKSVTELFEKQVEKTPQLIALHHKHVDYSYMQLNEKANQFAHWLVKNGVNQGDFVAILLEPNAEFMICILSIIKLGAIYVPLDTMAPQKRLKEITNDAKPKLIITSEEYKTRLNKTGTTIALIKHMHMESTSYSKANLRITIDPNLPLYLMYTSGSTGKPKGILIPHEAVVNLVKVDNYADIGEGTTVAQFSNLAFDACTFEIWSAFLNGAILSIIPAPIRTNYNDLKIYLQNHKIDCLFLPTGYFHQLIKSFPKTLNSVKKIIFGGEQVNHVLIKKFLSYRKINNLSVTLINGYGPTEATTFTCRHIMTEKSEFDDEEFMSIGNTIAHVKTYILDENKNQVPEGELYISGVNLALGYHNSENQNQEKFTSNPFESIKPYERIYKTGDRVKLLPSGKLLCLGRLDDQVKIGGFRIHLNEIENELMKHEAISLAAVVVEIGGGLHKMLTAYIVFASQKSVDHADDIRAFLSLNLPPYMLPAKYVVVDELPLTLVGKVDKKNLDKLPHTDLSFHVDTSSASAIEETIKKIWKHLLNRSNIETNRNLFELGANSLLMTEACARINDELHAELKISDLLTYPTIHRLSRFLEGDLDVPTVREQHAMRSSDIAIIGMSCRFPNANSPQEFWENLCQSKVSLDHFTEEELVHRTNKSQHKHFVPVRGILADVEQFDANFFGFNPIDASLADPQQRVFLECAWEAIEQAGVVPSQMGTKTISVFAGMADSTYLHENLLKNSWFCQEIDRFQQRIASSLGMLSTQVSYRLNLKGRSININTACSTGLVAVAQACQELMMGTSDVALAGAVSITVPQIDGYVYQPGGIESPDGQCRPFESRANGTVFANGAGVVILKRLEDALADNDTVYAVIKGVGVNNDGSDKLGYTAPSVHGQMTCIREALTRANVKADEIGYVEAHGTATALGDVVEIEALSAVYREQTNNKQYCALGSVKGNIGHNDVAAGMAGLIKTILCLFHKKIPSMPNFEKPNPNINFAESPFFINPQLVDWKIGTSKRYAATSSFGVGGTNVHMVLSEHVQAPPTAETASEYLMVLSAKTEAALQQNVEKFTDFLEHSKHGDSLGFADIAYTLQTGREPFQWRCFSVGNTVDEIVKEFSRNKMNFWDENIHHNVVFMFPGQGMQYHQMAAQLMDEIPFFASLVRHGIELASSHLGVDLLEIINNPSDQRLNQTQYAQPALFIIEYALANLLIYYGLKPDAVIGHSIGEYVAACLSGIFTFEDAIAVVCQRGLLMTSASTGEMLAIECSKSELPAYLNQAELALHNSINHCVVSGKASDIHQLEQTLLKDGKLFRKLKVSHAFHSSSMEEIQKPFISLFSNITLSAPQIPIISNVTGTWLSAQEATDPNYWYKHLRQTVQFCKGIETVLEDQHLFFIEVGPGQSLNVFLKEIVNHHKKKVSSINVLTNSHTQKNDLKQLLTVIGMAWQHGFQITWPAMYEDVQPKHLPLPTYAFQKQKYWIDSDTKQTSFDGKPTFYKPIWSQQQICPFELSDTIENLHDHTWIIFKDKLGIADQIINFLKSNNTNPIIIETSELYSEEQGEYFKINPSNKNHYIKVISAIGNRLYNPIVLHCLTCSNTGKGMLSHREIDGQLELGFYSILFLAQSYLECVGDQRALKTLIISAGTQQVVGSESLIPVNASLMGPCRGLNKEHSSIQCKLIDINPDEPLFSLQNLLNIVFSVCLNEAWSEESSIVAYRNNYRWDLTYGLAKSHKSVFRLKDGGTYLVTGGLGGIALVICEAITKSIKNPRFILLSRTSMIPEEEWEHVLEDPNHAFYQKISELKKMQILGAHFIFHQVDVAEFESLSLIINHYTTTEKINGVIHGAGIAGGGLMTLKSQKMMHDILLPKIHGTYNLAKAFQDYPLDFVVLQSSIAAVTGEPGQIDYCAANSCLDAFSVSKLFSTSFILSINWNTWRDIGMAVDAARIYKENFLTRGNDISPAQGQQLFLQAMQRQDPNLVVSNFDIEYYSTKTNQKIAGEKNVLPKQARQNLNPNVDYAPPSNPIEKQLAQLWQDNLGIEQIGINDDFFMLGGHSLKAINLMGKINKIFNCNFPVTQIYSAPTIRQLCSTILNNSESILPYTAILLKEKKNYPNLFLCHPISGLINSFQSFVSQSKLPMSIYGLQDPSIEKNKMLYDSLLSMAEDYLLTIKKIQPVGPYFLVGYSFGGNVLFEVANKLLQQGEKVSLLALIDSWAINSPILHNKIFFKKHLEEISGLSEEVTNLAWERQQFLLNHSLSTMDQEILLFKASYLSDVYQTIDHPTNGWSKYNKGKIICHTINSNHENILDDENSGIILQLIMQYLKKYGIANETLEKCTD